MHQPHPFYPFMLRALSLAELARGDTCPNPVVGAVLVKDGRVVAEGRHACCGGAHAEVAVLQQAVCSGVDPKECTLVVTLEPCAHHGKTPPCCEAVLAAGIRHVVVGLADPTPRAGGGAAFLRKAGVRVDMGVAAELCAGQLADFMFWQHSALPFVSLKLAASLDGAIATRSGESRWITGHMARWRVQELRSTVQAVMVGGNTFRQDNPRLTCRLGAAPQNAGAETEAGSGAADEACACVAGAGGADNFAAYNLDPHGFAPGLGLFPGAGRAGLPEAVGRAQPLAVVVSAHLPEAGANYYLLRERAAQTVFLTSAQAAESAAADALRKLGAAIIAPPADLPDLDVGEDSGEDSGEARPGLSAAVLRHNLAALRRDYNCWRILCEGGGRLALFLLKHGLAQQLELHLAPLIVGDDAAVRVFSGLNPQHLADALRLRPALQGRACEDMVVLLNNGY